MRAATRLLAFELEMMAAELELGLAFSASVEFLRPTQPGALSTRPKTERKGRRVSVLSNALHQGDVVTARASVCFIKPADVPEVQPPEIASHQPETLSALPPKKAIHGLPWMMDNFEVRPAPDGIIWFRYIEDLVEDMTPMARVLGPADWTHGLGRPSQPKLADPNINLQVVLSRHPGDAFIGIRPNTTWMPTGIGMGSGTLFDQQGVFGKVQMSVALTQT